MAQDRMVVVAIAGSPVEATIWVDALRDAGIPAGSFERGVGGAFGGAATGGWASFPVLADAGQIGEARSIVAGLGGAQALAPVVDEAEASAKRTRVLKMIGGAIGLAMGAAVLLRFVS